MLLYTLQITLLQSTDNNTFAVSLATETEVSQMRSARMDGKIFAFHEAATAALRALNLMSYTCSFKRS